MKPQSVGPWWATVLVCVAQAVVPVCRRSAIVCVAACSAACTAWAAVPECVSLHMRLVLCAPPRVCSVSVCGIAGEVSREGCKNAKMPISTGQRSSRHINSLHTLPICGPVRWSHAFYELKNQSAAGHASAEAIGSHARQQSQPVLSVYISSAWPTS